MPLVVENVNVNFKIQVGSDIVEKSNNLVLSLSVHLMTSKIKIFDKQTNAALKTSNSLCRKLRSYIYSVESNLKTFHCKISILVLETNYILLKFVIKTNLANPISRSNITQLIVQCHKKPSKS